MAKGMHVRIPYFSRTARLRSDCLDSITWIPVLAGANSSFQAPLSEESPIAFGKVVISNATAGSSTIVMNRSASDDAMLGQYIGPPFLALLTSSVGTIYDTDSSYFPN
jgi:hypothetical protein